jgi:hypothetical protein
MGITAPRPGISGGAQPEERNLRGLICRASGPCAPPAHLELQRQPLFELGGIAQQARAVKEAVLARGALDEPVAPFLAESPQATHLPPGPVKLLLGAAFRACCGSRIGGSTTREPLPTLTVTDSTPAQYHGHTGCWATEGAAHSLPAGRGPSTLCVRHVDVALPVALPYAEASVWAMVRS